MISADGAGAPVSAAVRPQLRWIASAALLAAEFLVLSLLVDLPTTGPAVQLVEAVRVAIPVALGAGVAGWLVVRGGGAPSSATARPLPPWRPGLALVAQLAAFAGTVVLTWRLLGEGAPPAGSAAILALLGCGAALLALALAAAVPLPWLARELLPRWRVPLLALALGIGVWRMAAAAEQLWGTLAGFTLRGAGLALRLVSADVQIDPSLALIGVGDFVVRVAPECSGVDGLGLVLVFGLTWLALARDRVRSGRALLLLPLALIVTLAASIARITGLVLLGAAGHEALALGGFHSKVGWAMFIALALGFVALTEHLPWLRRAAPAAPAPDSSRPRTDAALLAPLLAALASALLTGVWTVGALDPLYGVRILAALAALLAVRRALPSLRPASVVLSAAVGLGVGVLWVVGVRADPAPLGAELSRLAPWGRAGWLAVRALGSVLVIPVIEELAFRGFLFDLLAPAPRDGARSAAGWLAVGGSALAFGALHTSFVAGVLAGLAFGALRAWRGRVGDAVLAHLAANLVVAAAALALGRWDLWG